MRQSGSEEDCKQATEGKPHAGCRSPLQLFLLPIPNHVVEVQAFQKHPIDTPAAEHVAEQPKKSGTLRLISYIVGGLGVAGLGGGGASFAISSGTEGRIKNGTFATPDDIVNAQGSMQSSHTLGAIGLISGGLLLGAALPLFILGGK